MSSASQSVPAACSHTLERLAFAAGVRPSAIASDASGSYVYVTDFANGDVLGYSVAPGTAAVAGALVPLGGSPFRAGNQPSAIVVDPSYPFAYVANSLDGTVTAYSMSSGALASIGTFSTGLQPVAVESTPRRIISSTLSTF